MIKIVFLDFGETLVHDGLPFPGVTMALAALAKFKTADGEPLRTAIVSNFHLPDEPATEAAISVLETQYRNEALGPSGLAAFFEPFQSCVTISSRAGVNKPNNKIYKVALARLGGGASLSECLLVTENLLHLHKCAEDQITPVRFGPPLEGMANFDSWADAPAILARLIAPGQTENLAAAAAAALVAKHGILRFNMEAADGDTLHGNAQQLLQLRDERLGSLDGIYVENPCVVTVHLANDGRVAGVETSAADPEVVADAVNFVSSLMKSGRVAMPGQPSPLHGVTHAVENDSEGRAHLVRKRYSAG